MKAYYLVSLFLAFGAVCIEAKEIQISRINNYSPYKVNVISRIDTNATKTQTFTADKGFDGPVSKKLIIDSDKKNPMLKVELLKDGKVEKTYTLRSDDDNIYDQDGFIMGLEVDGMVAGFIPVAPHIAKVDRVYLTIAPDGHIVLMPFVLSDIDYWQDRSAALKKRK